MKVPLSWLHEYLALSLAPEEIAEALTLAGLEVDAIHHHVLEISLTPNLAHCASVRGVARELAAICELSLHSQKFELAEKGEDLISTVVSVHVANPKGCPRYACRLIRHVHVTSSPLWLKERLEACGFRSINNVVDVTNLILLELGQPLHAFDFDQLEGKCVRVRNAEKGEQIQAIDGKKYDLSEQDLMICDAKKPIAIAGIMGSLESEVSNHTKTILLESAYFDPSQIRQTTKRLGIHSEASYRFERGTDPNEVTVALDKATALLCELTKGECLRDLIDVVHHPFPQKEVSCRLNRVNQLLGTHLAMSEIETIFRRLGFTHSAITEDLITLHIPTYRHDIHQEIDLIEEVARLYGYGTLRKNQKPLFRTGSLAHSQEYLFSRQVRGRLISDGLQELLTCDLIGPEQASLISPDNFPSRTLIKLLNPRSVDQSIMRPSMLPGLLSAVKYNIAHGVHAISGFEVGRVHFTVKDKYYEPSAAAIVLTGEQKPPHWEGEKNLVDFFDLKGMIENLFMGLKLSNLSFLPTHYANFHPHRQAKIVLNQVEVGIMGEIHPHTLKKIDITQRLYFAEISLDDLQRFVQKEIQMTPLPEYPASHRDWTLTLKEDVHIGDILAQIQKESSQLLESVSLIGIYRSDRLGSNLKNVTFRCVYRDPLKTTLLEDVEKEHQSMIKKVTNHLH